MSSSVSSAVIIANGEACETNLLQVYVNQSSFVLVLDGAINRAVKLPFVLDALLGDFDGVVNVQNFISQYPNLKIIHTPDQNKTDLEKGIEYLVEEGFKKVFILWATGRRADHNLNSLSTMAKYKSEIEIELIDDFSNIINLPLYFKKKYNNGQAISLMPLSIVSGLTTKGLKYNLSNATLQLGYNTSSSNEVNEEGFVEVWHQNGNLILMECKDIT